MDVVVEWLGPAVEEWLGDDELAGGVVEVDRVGERLAEFLVGGRCGEREREGSVVADEHPVLHVAEVAADQTAAGRVVLTIAQAEEPGEVDDAGVLHLFVRQRHAEFAEPVGQGRAPSGRDHDQVTVERGPVIESDAADDRAGRRRSPPDRRPLGHPRT